MNSGSASSLFIGFCRDGERPIMSRIVLAMALCTEESARSPTLSEGSESVE